MLLRLYRSIFGSERIPVQTQRVHRIKNLDQWSKEIQEDLEAMVKDCPRVVKEPPIVRDFTDDLEFLHVCEECKKKA